MQSKLPIAELIGQFEELRQQLIRRPGSFSLENGGQLLESLGQQLREVLGALSEQDAISPEQRRQLSEMLGLSRRVSALYEQALVLYAPPY